MTIYRRLIRFLTGAAVAISASAVSLPALAGKFKPVESEDWPETGESKSQESGDAGDEDGSPRQPSGMPQIRTMEDGTPDPESLKDFFK